MSGDIMQPRSPASPAGLSDSSHSMQCSPHAPSRGRGARPLPESPFTWNADTLPRGTPRAGYVNGSLSPTAGPSAPQLPPPSPSKHKGAAAAATVRGIDALLLNDGQPTPAAQASGGSEVAAGACPPSPRAAARDASPCSQPFSADRPGQPAFAKHAHSLESACTASTAIPMAAPSRGTAALRAAAAELADRISADESAAAPGQLRTPQLRAVTPQPAATTAQEDANVLALKLTVVAGPSTDKTYITAKDTKQVRCGVRILSGASSALGRVPGGSSRPTSPLFATCGMARRIALQHGLVPIPAGRHVSP